MSRIYLLSSDGVRQAVEANLIKLVGVKREKTTCRTGMIFALSVELTGACTVLAGPTHGLRSGDVETRNENGRTVVTVYYVNGPEAELDKLMRAYGAVLCGYVEGNLDRGTADLLIYADQDGNCLS